MLMTADLLGLLIFAPLIVTTRQSVTLENLIFCIYTKPIIVGLKCFLHFNLNHLSRTQDPLDSEFYHLLIATTHWVSKDNQCD